MMNKSRPVNIFAAIVAAFIFCVLSSKVLVHFYIFI